MRSISIDVLITTFNSEKYIKETINSVLNQSYKNFKIIIVDDCSTDKTFEICKKYKEKYKNKIKLFKLKKNSTSASVPRNFGIKKCRSNFIAFLDSDDIWSRNKLEIQVSKINKSSKLYFSNCEYFRDKKKIGFFIFYIRTLFQIIFSNLIKKNREWLFLYNPIAFSSVIVQRIIFKKLQFDTAKNFVGIEDLSLWYNFLKIYKDQIVYDIKPLVLIRRRKNSLHSDYNFQTVKSINLISNIYLSKKNFINIYIFLFSIAYKAIRPLIKNSLNFLKINFKQFFFSILLILYILLFSPIYKLLGSNLLEETYNQNKINNIIIYSGPTYETYVNQIYKIRYVDLKNILKNNSNINIYILGRIQVIPEQRLLRSLLISEGLAEDKIRIIYKDLGNSSKNLENLYNLLMEKNVNEVLFVTSPYLTKRIKLLWNKYSDDITINFYKTLDWPSKELNLFGKYKNKDIIIYEYSAIMYNYLSNKF